MSTLRVRFWGVRGSVPAPPTDAELRQKCVDMMKGYAIYQSAVGKITPETYVEKSPILYHGGNTSCVEVINGDERIVLDMGTGLRPLGNALFKEMMGKKGLAITFLLSHIHWDHIQGLPFFGPLYVNKATGILNNWNFYGGTDWQKTIEICLRGQMDPPNFPVSLEEVELMTHKISYHDVHDQMAFAIDRDGFFLVTCRKLNHPQETYGWRLEDKLGKTLVYTTDNEPYDPCVPDPRLVDLARDADIWITDCQYSRDIYNGIRGGVPRHGWGHSYPEAVAATAIKAKVKKVITFHHDPAASDEDIEALRRQTQELIKAEGGSAQVLAAYEGLDLEL